MAAVNHWSDHFNATSFAAPATPQATRPVGYKPPWGISNRHSKRAFGTAVVGSFDSTAVMRMMTLRSIDRITRVWFTATGGTAIAGNIGLYLSGSQNDGAIVNGNIFAATLAMAGTVVNADVFASGTAANTRLRGLTVWEILGLTADTGLDYDLCITCTTTLTTLQANLVISVDGAFH
jgi:hypothetical protein